MNSVNWLWYGLIHLWIAKRVRCWMRKKNLQHSTLDDWRNWFDVSIWKHVIIQTRFNVWSPWKKKKEKNAVLMLWKQLCELRSFQWNNIFNFIFRVNLVRDDVDVEMPDVETNMFSLLASEFEILFHFTIETMTMVSREQRRSI